VREVGALRVYADAPGVVVRCPGCDGVVLRFMRDDNDIRSAPGAGEASR
jgi:hypothetical protein